MKTKTYRCDTVQAAMRLAKIELGDEAVLLDSKEMKDGRVGKLAVTFAQELESAAAEQELAANDPRIEPAPWQKYLPVARRQPGGLAAATAAAKAAPVAQAPSVRVEAERPQPQAFPTERPQPKAAPAPSPAPRRFAPYEMEDAPDAAPDLWRLGDALAGAQRQAAARIGAAAGPATPLLSRIHSRLLSRGVEPKLSAQLLEGLAAEEERGASGRLLESMVRERLLTRWKTAPGVGRRSEGMKIVAFVGPSGAGKTSLIGKLAARCLLHRRGKVHLVSVDQVRVGAVEPLQAYASLLGLELTRIDDISRLASFFDSLNRSGEQPDYVFIDTPGYGPNEEREARRLALALNALGPVDVQLVASAVTRPRDLRRALDRFSVFRPNRLAFTRLDETDGVGSFLTESSRLNLPISFTSAGQQSPDDLEAADPGRLTDLLLGRRVRLGMRSNS